MFLKFLRKIKYGARSKVVRNRNFYSTKIHTGGFSDRMDPTDFFLCKCPTITERDDKNKLFVGNVPFKATPDDLRAIFSQYGEVVDVFIPRDSIGEPRGFAFVTCTEADIEAIRQGADGAELMGRTLSVNPPLAPGEKEVRKQKSGKLMPIAIYSVE